MSTREMTKAILRLGRLPIVALANERDAAEEAQECVGLENEFAVGADGWVRIAPYGRHLKERIVRDANGQLQQEAYEQVLDKAAAELMARKFNSPIGKLRRFMRGAPIFKHHPDLKEHAPETISTGGDKTPVGMFAGLEAREDGFYGRPVFSEAGQAAIENEGLKWLSPLWWAQVVSTGKNIREAHPREFISAGLTKHPNIPGGEALANQKETHMNKPKLLAALNAIGLALANEATDEQIETAIGGLSLKSKVTALENEKATLTTQLTQAKGAQEAVTAIEKTAREKAEKDLSETRTALANERKARIELVVDGAVQAGKITIAERAAWIGRLEASFDANVTALANEAVKVKTVPVTGKLGERKAEADKTRDASDQFLALANERMEKDKCDFDTAWSRTKKANPALYEAMSGNQ